MSESNISAARMLAVSERLESCLRSCSGRSVSPQLREELQKQAAAAAEHTALLREITEGTDDGK